MTRDRGRAAAEAGTGGHAGPEFSAIVPTLDEEAQLEETLRRARCALGPETEFIIVDGGSRDRTPEIAALYGRLLIAPRGRGVQLAAGAREATGRVLVFLHADTWLPEGSAAALRESVLAGAGAGCFRFALHPRAREVRYRVLEWGVNWRTRRFRTATGDQTIFASRGAYDACGGIPALPLFEDVAFVRAVRRVTRFEPLTEAARTSRRRWEGAFLRTIVRHWGLRAAFAAGVNPHRLSRYHERGAPP
ncbi:TIGR04283 family arsenosugar biosynthesis glycosyltransferase [Candidatus Palauibacter sp.]|uniref:TIGR04283 family arsenosugar biosynthesis glycosyltransferase n=1 Tax=Candidatus Palauibacter sp. TaxID=3101350 RepID=UPI003AF2A58A